MGSIRLGDGERPGSHSTLPARVCSGPLIKFLSLSQRAEEATFDPVHLYLAKNNNSHNDKHHHCMLAVCLMLHEHTASSYLGLKQPYDISTLFPFYRQ